MPLPFIYFFPPASPEGRFEQVTEGPDEGKIAVLDFGLVAEVPQRDREAILSAIIHLANRDWWDPAPPILSRPMLHPMGGPLLLSCEGSLAAFLSGCLGIIRISSFFVQSFRRCLCQLL